MSKESHTVITPFYCHDGIHGDESVQDYHHGDVYQSIRVYHNFFVYSQADFLKNEE